MRLLVVESPAKARTLQALLGTDFLVRATRGHIRDLPKSGLGVDARKAFRPQWRSLPSVRGELAAIESEAYLCSDILLATDPDREGETIAAHVADRLAKTRRPIRRVRLSEVTADAVARALSEAGPIDTHLVEAQAARRVIDRLIGYTVSPSLSAATERGPVQGLGRVGAATLALVRERELFTERPAPAASWRVDVDWTMPDGRSIATTLDALFPDEQAAAAQARSFEDLTATVASVGPRAGDANAPIGLTTYDLLIRGARDAGLTPSDAMRAAQRLYEGISRLDAPPLALVSYPRTDDPAMPPSVVRGALDVLNAGGGGGPVPDERDPGRVRAHGCLHPVSWDWPPETVRPFLSPGEFRVYRIVWEGTLEGCRGGSPGLSADPLRMHVDAPTGAVTVRMRPGPPGERHGPSAGADGHDRPSAPGAGTPLAASRVRVRSELDPPPPPHTDDTLVEAMRASGVARPSTCASVLQGLFDRGYVSREGRTIQTTPLGRRMLQVLDERYPDLTDPAFTKAIEADLDAIAAGQTDYETVVGRFYERWILPHLSDPTPSPRENGAAYSARPPGSAPSARCPECGRPLVERRGRFGEFYGCTGYPKCRFTRPKP